MVGKPERVLQLSLHWIYFHNLLARLEMSDHFQWRFSSPQVTSMIATGPRPPLSFNSSNDESPVKLDIGGGMGEINLPNTFARHPCMSHVRFMRLLSN